MRLLYTFKNNWPPEVVFAYKGFYHYKYFDHISDSINTGISIKEFSSNDFRLIKTNEPVTKEFLNEHL